MAGLLESLAQGLRGAGAVLSPDVYQQQNQEERIGQQLQQQQRQLMAQQVIKGAESGAIPPEQAKVALAKLFPGVELPVGPDAATQQRQEEIKRRDAIAQSFKELPPEDLSNPIKRAEVFLQHGDHATGAKYLEVAEARQARAQQTAEALEARKFQLAQAHEARMQGLQTAQDRAAEAARHNQMMEGLTRQSHAVQATLAQGAQQLRGMQMQMMGDRQREANDQKLDNQTMKFSNELQQNKVPATITSITTANEMLKKYADKDIPGLGVIVGSKLVPNAARSEEAKNVRSSLQAVSNDLLNMYSGLAVTLPEGERRELEEMKNGTFSSQDFKNAWPRIVNRANAIVGNLSAGAGPQVTERYQSRPGALKLAPIAPAFGQSAAQSNVRAQADAILGR